MRTKRLRRAQKPVVQERLVQLIEAGFTVKYSCHLVGIDYTTYYKWLQRDTRFRGRIREAEARAVIAAESVIRKAIAEGDVKTAMWYLERRVPEYRPPARVQLTKPSEYDDYELLVTVIPSNEPDSP